LWAPELINVLFNMPQYSNMSTAKYLYTIVICSFKYRITAKYGKITMTIAAYFTLHIIEIPSAIHLSMTINHSGQIHQVGNPKKRTPRADDNFGILR